MNQPKNRWGFASKCNDFIRNVHPVTNGAGRYPLHTVTGRTFDHTVLRVPFSTCYPLIEGKQLDSHADRREEMVFVGYDYHTPSYQVWHVKRNKVYSRAYEDVRFDERKQVEVDKYTEVGVTHAYRVLRRK